MISTAAWESCMTEVSYFNKEFCKKIYTQEFFCLCWKIKGKTLDIAEHVYNVLKFFHEILEEFMNFDWTLSLQNAQPTNNL